MWINYDLSIYEQIMFMVSILNIDKHFNKAFFFKPQVVIIRKHRTAIFTSTLHPISYSRTLIKLLVRVENCEVLKRTYDMTLLTQKKCQVWVVLPAPSVFVNFYQAFVCQQTSSRLGTVNKSWSLEAYFNIYRIFFIFD